MRWRVVTVCGLALGLLVGSLGGKGAGLAEMTAAGLPVPSGFTITTDACLRFYENEGVFPEGLQDQIGAAMRRPVMIDNNMPTSSDASAMPPPIRKYSLSKRFSGATDSRASAAPDGTP